MIIRVTTNILSIGSLTSRYFLIRHVFPLLMWPIPDTPCDHSVISEVVTSDYPYGHFLITLLVTS